MSDSGRVLISDREPCPPQYLSPLYRPHGKYSNTLGLRLHSWDQGEFLGCGKASTVHLRHGILRGESITFVSKIWRGWEGLHTEIYLYAHPRCLRPLQGVCVPHIIGVFETDAGIANVAMELPHAAAWRTADVDLPRRDKLAIIQAYAKIHAQGVLHGAVLLNHMLVGFDGKVTIVNFRRASCLSPNKLVGLKACSIDDFAIEMRHVKFLLDFDGAREREYRLATKQCTRKTDCQDCISPYSGINEEHYFQESTLREWEAQESDCESGRSLFIVHDNNPITVPRPSLPLVLDSCMIPRGPAITRESSPTSSANDDEVEKLLELTPATPEPGSSFTASNDDCHAPPLAMHVPVAHDITERGYADDNLRTLEQPEESLRTAARPRKRGREVEDDDEPYSKKARLHVDMYQDCLSLDTLSENSASTIGTVSKSPSSSFSTLTRVRASPAASSRDVDDGLFNDDSCLVGSDSAECSSRLDRVIRGPLLPSFGISPSSDDPSSSHGSDTSSYGDDLATPIDDSRWSAFNHRRRSVVDDAGVGNLGLTTHDGIQYVDGLPVHRNHSYHVSEWVQLPEGTSLMTSKVLPMSIVLIDERMQSTAYQVAPDVYESVYTCIATRPEPRAASEDFKASTSGRKRTRWEEGDDTLEINPNKRRRKHLIHAGI
ncbi:hypothetical protein BV25DRAFT_545290 [Artomyces pyxidatus]|uniref:Uncharacterized protein n=1 Tax=Artomyces pyxidatus TaxID=48021 RepID=A0ACB8TIJ2_9AGAM|nr:hypothetical protein BV25DRAFT_545290 [Artomyces pyxidatus]